MSIPMLFLLCILCLSTAIQTQARPNLDWLKRIDTSCGNATHYTCVHNYQCCRKVDELCDPNDKDYCVRQDPKEEKVSLEQCCDTVNPSLEVRMACDRLLFSDKEKSVKSQCATEPTIPSTNITRKQCCETVCVDMAVGDQETCARLLFSDKKKGITSQCAPEPVVPSTNITLEQCCETAGADMSLDVRMACDRLLFSNKMKTLKSQCNPKPVDLPNIITLNRCCRTTGGNLSAGERVVCKELLFANKETNVASVCALKTDDLALIGRIFGFITLSIGIASLIFVAILIYRRKMKHVNARQGQNGAQNENENTQPLTSLPPLGAQDKDVSTRPFVDGGRLSKHLPPQIDDPSARDKDVQREENEITGL